MSSSFKDVKEKTISCLRRLPSLKRCKDRCRSLWPKKRQTKPPGSPLSIGRPYDFRKDTTATASMLELAEKASTASACRANLGNPLIHPQSNAMSTRPSTNGSSRLREKMVEGESSSTDIRETVLDVANTTTEDPTSTTKLVEKDATPF